VDGEVGVVGVVVARWGGGGTAKDAKCLEANIRLSRASVLKVADPRLRSSKITQDPFKCMPMIITRVGHVPTQLAHSKRDI
jgi:hypothetical protein